AQIPDPAAVGRAFWDKYLPGAAYWDSWAVSFVRVGYRVLLAQLLGIPLGLLLGARRLFHGVVFPVVGVLGPIRALAWRPLSVIFAMISIGPAGYPSNRTMSYAEKRMTPWQP